jgi:hypothetical protein
MIGKCAKGSDFSVWRLCLGKGTGFSPYVKSKKMWGL